MHFGYQHKERYDTDMEVAKNSQPFKSELTACEKLRDLIVNDRTVVVPGVTSALNALLVKEAGFEVTYLSGAGLTNTLLGMPDLGLLSLNELADTATKIGQVCDLPLIVDVDTGFGNAVNVNNCVKVMERAGAAAIQIEDQSFPKKCGHFDKKKVVPLDEMLGKLKSALDARIDENFVIIARTDSAEELGFNEAIDRSLAFIECGVDMVFVEAPRSYEEIKKISELNIPTLLNIVVGGKTPMLPFSELQDLGISMVLYANACLQTVIFSVTDCLRVLKSTGSLKEFEDRMASFEERQKLLDLESFKKLEILYAK